MGCIHGAVEFRILDEWYEVINVGVLLLRHSDLNGCLFGVDNYAGYVPLFPDRGLPSDCSYTLRSTVESLTEEVRASWATWPELKSINWEERAITNDERITEFEKTGETWSAVTKWLNKQNMDAVREALDRDPAATIQVGDRMFRRLILKREDALEGTDFPLLMKLMACLAERFGDDGVRLTVWFD